LSSEKQITILIPTAYDSRYMIELCLACVRKYTEYPHKIFVGDDGVAQETRSFLEAQTDIHLFNVPPTYKTIPKDYLVQLVDTDYFVFLHDDIQILKYSWLESRVRCMKKKETNAIVGEFVPNFGANKWDFLCKKRHRRFLPLGLLVKTAVAKELNLKWGVVKDKYDTGGYAYQQFFSQKKWKFVRYPMKYDIKHLGGMTWPLKKKLNKEKTSLDLDNLIDIRNKRIEIIKHILQTKSY